MTTWEESGSWGGSKTVEALREAAPDAMAPSPSRTTIADAVAAFLAIREGANIAHSTIRKYRTFCRQLCAFADSRGYVMLDQFTAADIDVFYSRWQLGPRSKGKALGTLWAFFRFAVAREWLTKTPVTSDLKPPLGANRVANKFPFTDEELERIYTACDRLGCTEWANGQKNGGDVFMWIPDWLGDRLIARAKKHGQRPFITGESDRLETVTDLWRRRLNKVFEVAGKFDQTPTPHRFRHTFARVLLQRGVPVSDVADLLGDDGETVREHYARGCVNGKPG